MGITRNKIVDAHQGRARQRRITDQVASNYDTPREPLDVAERLIVADEIARLDEMPQRVLRLAFYEDLIEEFFKTHWLTFHCCLVERAVVRKEFHQGDYDLARRKHFTMLLKDKVAACLKARPGREPMIPASGAAAPCSDQSRRATVGRRGSALSAT